MPFETFYGRKQEQSDIMDPNGPCFIYGGKRLGKTALLYEVVEEFHKPVKGQIALFIDLKREGIGYNLPIDHLWVVLVEKARLPRVKPCGGGLNWKTVRVLPFAIDAVVERIVSRVVFTQRCRHPFDLRHLVL